MARWVLIRYRSAVFYKIARYSDTIEIMMLAKVKGLERYKRFLRKSFRELLYKGLSTKKRIEYWNTIARLEKKKELYKSKYDYYVRKKSEHEDDIVMDIERTYPLFGYFKYGYEGYNQLLNVLKAVAREFKDIGYCQGMNFFSAVILLILGNEEVLILSEGRMHFGWCRICLGAISIASASRRIL